ncbi:MAG: peptidase C39 family protein [Fimbriimonas sp.]|nr:peptidase C39 family protein [Fimbriimonas sp.]
MSPLLAVLSMTLLSASNCRLVSLEPNLEFPSKGAEIVKEFTDIDAGMPFDEMIASWNVEQADGAELKVEIRAHGDRFDTRWFTMGEWSLDVNAKPRGSVKGQHGSDGLVDTDTLILKKSATKIDARITLRTIADGPQARLKLLAFSFENGAETPVAEPSVTSAWGKTIDVPERAQGNYPNGGVLCSATSVSMILWHYSNVLGKPEMNKDVPEVEAHVWDPVYKGAGNWPFNTAYAGSFPGMRAYVARFNGITDLEKWIDDGLPVICSVSFDLLRGLPLSPTESGHLVVLVGFTKDGEPVINDPAFKNQVRRVYKRSDFEKAWNYSKRTVYLVYPENSTVPKNTSNLWIGSK